MTGLFMRFKKILLLSLVLSLTVLFIQGTYLVLNAQQNEPEGLKAIKSAIQEQMSSGNSKRSFSGTFQNEPPDTSFTYEKYSAFLSKISDTSKYIVLPVDEFRKTINSKKIVIGLRHDVDVDLKKAYDFSKTETSMGFRSTYYILHTADYYLASPSNKAVHSDSIIPLLKLMQDKKKFEIGWHNDLVTLQVVYHIDPVQFLHQELSWLRSNGIKITGSASHGSNFCKVYWYLNFYFFEECTWPVVGQFVNNINVPDGSGIIPIKKGKFSDFNLEYEAYFLNNNKYFSDATITNGKRWNISMLDVASLKPGDRVILLLHPVHWHLASTLAEIQVFSIKGQENCVVNSQNRSINVIMPYGSDKRKLTSSFTLSPGAYAKVLGTQQTSGTSVNNFTSPVVYTVYAENRDITQKWTVKVENAKNSACNIESISSPGYSGRVIIDQVNKSVVMKVRSVADITNLPVQFNLSEGASAYVGQYQQFSNTGVTDFSQPVFYKVVAQDGVSVCEWIVSVEKEDGEADILSFSLPGMTRAVLIDKQSRNIQAEVRSGQALKNIPAMFRLSANARCYVNGREQISGLSQNDFEAPVIYKVISEDSLTFKTWTIITIRKLLPSDRDSTGIPQMQIYPDPVNAKALIRLQNISMPESRLEIFNSQGIRIYLSTVSNTGTFVEQADLSGLPPGIYVLKCSSVSSPVTFVLGQK